MSPEIQETSKQSGKRVLLYLLHPIPCMILLTFALALSIISHSFYIYIATMKESAEGKRAYLVRQVVRYRLLWTLWLGQQEH